MAGLSRRTLLRSLAIAASAGVVGIELGRHRGGRKRMEEYLSRQAFFMVPTRPSDAANRVEAALKALEAHYPTPPLVHLGVGERVELQDRLERLSVLTKSGPWDFGFSNGRTYVSYGARMPDHDEGVILFSTVLSGESFKKLGVIVPLGNWDVTEAVVRDVGDALDAHWAYVSPSPAFDVMRHAQWGAEMPVEPEELTIARSLLPRLRYSEYTEAYGPSQPEILGWINYWSAGTVAFLTDGRPDKVSGLFARTATTGKGAMMMWVTEEPLDLSLRAHLEALAALYRDMPRLGVRL